MTSYRDFASTYDRLMANVPYDAWVKRISELMVSTGIKDGLALELGCGTGSVTRRLAALGYDMIGLDISGEMLEKAWEEEFKAEAIRKEREKHGQGRRPRKFLMELEKEASGGTISNPSEILYLQQDMRKFELFGTVRSVICVCDSINYLLVQEDLVKVFSLVNNYLDPEGLLIVDFHTPGYFREVLSNRTITEIDEDVVLIWENEETEEGCHASYLTIFYEQRDGKYIRTDEAHLQRGYTMQEMWEAAVNAGLADIKFYDGYTKRPARESSERIVMTAREFGKKLPKLPPPKDPHPHG